MALLFRSGATVWNLRIRTAVVVDFVEIWEFLSRWRFVALSNGSLGCKKRGLFILEDVQHVGRTGLAGCAAAGVGLW